MGKYLRLVEYGRTNEKENAFLIAKRKEKTDYVYEVLEKKLLQLPNSILGYWLSDSIFNAFERNEELQQYADVKKGMTTSDNNRFLRMWWEVVISKIGFDGYSDKCKWFRTHKGGYFRRWYGNNENVVNWEDNGSEIKNFPNAVVRNSDYYFKECITWTDVSMSKTSFRYVEEGSISNASGPSIYTERRKLFYLLGLLNSKVADVIYSLLCPTIHFEVGQVALFPIREEKMANVEELVRENVEICKEDLNYDETSWGFKRNPLI